MQKSYISTDESVRVLIENSRSKSLQLTKDGLMEILRQNENLKMKTSLSLNAIDYIWNTEGYNREFLKMYNEGYFNNHFDLNKAYKVLVSRV